MPPLLQKGTDNDLLEELLIELKDLNITIKHANKVNDRMSLLLFTVALFQLTIGIFGLIFGIYGINWNSGSLAVIVEILAILGMTFLLSRFMKDQDAE